MENNNKFLPIGTVVKLENAVKAIMIIGYYCKTDNNPDKIFDYCACLYPEGIISSDKNLFFDHKDIAEICYEGYKTDESIKFNNYLIDCINKNSQ